MTTEIWTCSEDGDTMEVTRREDGTVYGCGNSFDFERDSYEAAEAQLTEWGYRLVGWE